MFSEERAIAMGLSERHLVTVPETGRLHTEVVAPLQRLRERGRRAGFDIRVASGYRGYDRQLAIVNGKFDGSRAVCDVAGRSLHRADFDDLAWLHAILRYSALPGTSRHHWGTDFDVWDAAAVEADFELQLTPQEYAPDGPFAALSEWLGERIAADDAEGFFRPYAVDRGGVAPEPWHISHQPSTQAFAKHIHADALLALWSDDQQVTGFPVGETLACLDWVAPNVEALLAQYCV